MKIKTLSLGFLALFLLIGMKASAFTDTYLTSNTQYYTYYTDESRWISCYWRKSNDIYQCSDGSVWQSSGDCDRIGKPPAKWYGFNAFNSCTNQYICSNNGVPNPGGYWQNYQQAHTGSRTTYTCNYICGVTSWSACSSHSQSATSVRYCSTSGTSCSRTAALTQYCNNPPTATITSPTTGLTFEKQTNINFVGLATDPDGDAIDGYEWRDGNCTTGTLLSSSQSFTKNGLNPGAHTIYFRAKDNQGAWSSCAQVSLTIRPTCDPETAPAGSTWCPGDNENISGSSNVSAVKVNSLSACGSPKCEYYMLPVDGEVGAANSQVFCQRPHKDLCEKGTPSDVTEGDNGKTWEWTCQGLHGGEDTKGKGVKSCAYQEVNPN